MLRLLPILSTSAFLLRLLNFPPIVAFPTISNPVVYTTTGPVSGTQVSSDVLAWKGIPFAVPPTGPLRWTPPTLNKWSHVFDASSLGSACIQLLNKSEAATDPSQVFYNTPPLPESEDCLTINVWAPVVKLNQAPKAVLFWIFGMVTQSSTASFSFLIRFQKQEEGFNSVVRGRSFTMERLSHTIRTLFWSLLITYVVVDKLRENI